jgi:hypothetical protein
LFGGNSLIKADRPSAGKDEKVNVFTEKFAKFPEHAIDDAV